MKEITIYISDNEYELIKDYTAAVRKYEYGQGFTVKSTINQFFDMGLHALYETEVMINNDERVDWKKKDYLVGESSESRKVYVKTKK